MKRKNKKTKRQKKIAGGKQKRPNHDKLAGKGVWELVLMGEGGKIDPSSAVTEPRQDGAPALVPNHWSKSLGGES